VDIISKRQKRGPMRQSSMARKEYGRVKGRLREYMAIPSEDKKGIRIA